MAYDFEKSLTENSEHMDKIRKKFKGRKFSSDEIIEY